MSRFSPTVLPTWGQSLANALGGIANTYQRSKENAQNLDMEMWKSGYMRQPPGTTGAMPPTPGTPDVPQGTLPADSNPTGVGQIADSYGVGPKTHGPIDLAALGQAMQRARGMAAGGVDQGIAGGQGQVAGPQLAAALGTQSAPPAQPVTFYGRTYTQTPQAAESAQMGTAMQRAQLNNLEHPYHPPTVLAPGATVLGPEGKPGYTNAPLPKTQLVRQKDGSYVAVDVETGLDRSGRPVEGYTPPVQPQVIGAVDQDGNPHYFRVPKNGGPATPVQGLEPKPTSSGGGGGAGVLTPQAVESMYNQARQADAVMKAFEAKYALGLASVGGLSGALGGGVQEPVRGLASGLTSSASNALLAATNPEYQTYLAAQRRFGNIMANTQSRRYNEVQNQVDTDLSGLKSADVGPTVNLKQSYRDDLLNGLQKQVSQSPGGTAGSSGGKGEGRSGKATLSPGAYQALRAKGYTDADISQKYVIPHE